MAIYTNPLQAINNWTPYPIIMGWHRCGDALRRAEELDNGSDWLAVSLQEHLWS